jgi:signal transduction histidine kinase
MQDKPFYLTRLRLAAWYTGVMALILSLSGFAIYRLIAHTQWVNMEREAESVVEVLEETIEPALKQPGQVDPAIRDILPGICLVGTECTVNPNSDQESLIRAEQRLLSRIYEGNYCMRLLNPTHQVVALAQFPAKGLSPCANDHFWETLTDQKGHPYYEISRVIHASHQPSWGTMQVVRSLDDIDHYCFSVRIILLVGILLAIALTGIASWWLAGLAMQPVQRSYQRIQQFTADAAHELRTPLASLRASVQASVRESALSPQEALETLQTVDRQSYRLAQLVNSLLFLCQLDQQTMPIEPSLCCLNDLLRGLVEDVEALAIVADIQLKLDVRVTHPLHVLGNDEQLYRLVSNLIMNAIQHTRSGGQVTVVLDRNQNQAIIQVQDTGVGIADDDQARIFDRFYRAAQDRSHAQGGTGLGLAIAQAVAQSHQGNLTVQSQLGKGSVFTLRLPLKSSSLS